MVSESARVAFDDFVRARTPALARTAYLLTGDAHLAEDLVQTALFKAARAWHRIEGDPEPYVRRILYTQNVSTWRRRKLRETPVTPSGSVRRRGAAGCDSDLRLSLEAALARLTDRQRTVLVLRFFEDLTEVQTAAPRDRRRHGEVDDPRGAGPAPDGRAPSRGAAGGGVMTGEQLKHELARIAEAAPEVHVPDDLFARGRRATTRARVLIVAAAVACIGLVAGVTVPLVTSDDAPVTDADELAVPDHIYAPPSDVTGGTSDLKVGVAAGAYLTDDGLPVVVDAETGGYHPLDLEGITSRTPPLALGGELLSLSPDGRSLAWSWAGDADVAPRPTGIRIADLVTGTVRRDQARRGPCRPRLPARVVDEQRVARVEGHRAAGVVR